MVVRSVAAASVVIACSVAASARQLPGAAPSGEATTQGTAVIVGQVMDTGTGRGVPGAVVTISSSQPGSIPALHSTVTPPSPPLQPQALTTSDGRFLFRDLPKGTYTITATKPGYLVGSYGARRPGGGSAPLDLEDGEHATGIIVPVWKWGAISGAVADEAGEPLVGIEVRAFRRTVAPGGPRFAMTGSGMTDDRGVYRISNLLPGDYLVLVPGAIASVPISVAETIRDVMQSNDPNRLELSRTIFESGVSFVQPGSPGSLQIGSSLQTLRGATPPPVTDESRLFVYPTTFHPAARTLREAAEITIRSGDDRSGIDLQLTPVRASRVAGTVVGPEGPAAHIGLRLEAPTGEIQIEPEATTISDASGAFTFPVVPAGQYTLRASRIPRPAPGGAAVTIIQSGSMMISSTSNPGSPQLPPPSTDPTLWAEMPLAVGQRPVTGVTVALQIGSRIKGRVEFDGTAERPDAGQLQRLMVVVEPVSAPPIRGQMGPPARVEANGEFTTGGIPGGRHFVRAPATPPGWHFKEARYEGRDLSNTAINLDGRDVTGVAIVFTDRPTELTGTVRSGQGPPDADATVLIFPADPDTWQSPNPRRMRSVRTAKTGAYKVTGLPPGDYYLAAVPDELAADWQDARVLAVLSGEASRITLDDGDRKTQDLRTQKR